MVVTSDHNNEEKIKEYFLKKKVKIYKRIDHNNQIKLLIEGVENYKFTFAKLKNKLKKTTFYLL